MRTLFHSTLMKKTFLSYMGLLLLILFLFGGFTLSDIREKRLKEAQLSCQKDANAMMFSLNERFIRIQSTASKLSQLSWAWKLSAANNTFEDEFDPVRRRDIICDLQVILESDSLLQNLTLFFPQKDIAISAKGWASIADYPALVQTNLPDLEESLSSQHRYDVLFLNHLRVQDRPIIWMLTSLDYSKAPAIQAAFSIDQKALARWVEETASMNLLVFHLTDSNGNVLLHAGSETPSDGRPLYTVDLPVGAFGWHYQIVYDASLQHIPISDLNHLFWLFAIALTIGPLVAYFLTYLSYRPLRALLDKATIAIGRGSGNEYHLLENAFSRLREDNSNMKARVTEYGEFVQHDMLIRLLKGYFYKDELPQELSYYGIDYTEENKFCVLLADISHSIESENTQLSLENRMMATILLRQSLKNGPYQSHLIEFFDDKMVVILSDQKTPLEDAGLNAYLDTLQNSLALSVDIWRGKIESRILGISKSYHSARELQLAEDLPPPPTVSGTDLRESTAFIYYPTDWEVQLINGAKTGNQELVLKILEELQQENSRRNLPPPAAAMLFSSLHDTIHRLASELHYQIPTEDETVFPQKDPADTEAAKWSSITKAFQQLCCRTDLQAQASQDASAQILAYIRLNFQSPNLSLKEISQALGISTSTASKAFKNAANINFYDYTCRLRMEKAKELMKQSKISVRDLCPQVGYENEYSLRRTFLRYEGISISDYREKILHPHSD